MGIWAGMADFRGCMGRFWPAPMVRELPGSPKTLTFPVNWLMTTKPVPQKLSRSL